MTGKTVIYYYSGSGSTLSVSRKIAEQLGNTDVKSIYTLKENAHIPEEYERVGIATATWFIRPPRIVKEVCERMELNPSQKVFIIATCGGWDGYVRLDLKNILQPIQQTSHFLTPSLMQCLQACLLPPRADLHPNND